MILRTGTSSKFHTSYGLPDWNLNSGDLCTTSRTKHLTYGGNEVNRYLLPGLLVTVAISAVLLAPKNGDAEPSEPGLTVVYTGDVIGNIEPCG